MLQDRKAELSGIEQQLHYFALRYKAINAAERAASFAQRTADTDAENRHMRHEIQLLRNSDRVMVTLRDTHENHKKHHRIKTAHIRQKEATIHLIAKRCAEQRQERVRMLEQLERDCEALAQLAAEEADVEATIAGLRPLRSMSHVLRFDSVDEETVEATIRDIDALRRADDEVTVQLKGQLADFAASIDGAAGDKTATMDDIAAEWRDTKTRMLAEYQRLQKLGAELDFHVRRGTNIKATRNLPDGMTPEERAVRDLTLTLGEEETKLRAAQAEHAAMARRAAQMPGGHACVEAGAEAQAAAQARLAAQLAEAHREWRAKYRELQQAFTGAALDDADWDAASSAAGGGGAGHSPSHSRGGSASPGRGGAGDAASGGAGAGRASNAPRAFTPASAERLFSAKTKARAQYDFISRVEQEDRAQRFMAMRRRPAAPPPTTGGGA